MCFGENGNNGFHTYNFIAWKGLQALADAVRFACAKPVTSQILTLHSPAEGEKALPTGLSQSES